MLAKNNLIGLPKNTGKLYFPNGFKVTEVSATEAIVWTRLSHSEKPKPITHKKAKTKPKANNYYPVDFDENQPVKNMDGAIVGAKGKVRIKYKAMGETFISDWYKTESINDFTAQIPLGNTIVS